MTTTVPEGLFVRKVSETLYKVSGYNVNVRKRGFDGLWAMWAWEPYKVQQVGYGDKTCHRCIRQGYGMWHCIGVFKTPWLAIVDGMSALRSFIEGLGRSLRPQDLREGGYRYGSEFPHAS